MKKEDILKKIEMEVDLGKQILHACEKDFKEIDNSIIQLLEKVEKVYNKIKNLKPTTDFVAHLTSLIVTIFDIMVDKYGTETAMEVFTRYMAYLFLGYHKPQCLTLPKLIAHLSHAEYYKEKEYETKDK